MGPSNVESVGVEMDMTPITLNAKRRSCCFGKRRFLDYFPYLSPQYKLMKEISAELKARPEWPGEYWKKYPNIEEIAKSLALMLKKDLGWPNHYFLPEDCFTLLFFDYVGDLAQVECDLRVEAYFKLPADISLFDFYEREAEFKDVAASIYSLAGAGRGGEARPGQQR